MTVFIAHAPQDLEAAEALEKFLERRGLFVELEDGEQAFRPLQFTDAVVLLVSKDSVFSPWRLRHEKRALDAWAEQKLVLVKLDHNFAPVGLRDLPSIDASFEQQRDIAWAAVAKQISDMARPHAPAAASQSQSQSLPPGDAAEMERRAEQADVAPARKKSGGALGALVAFLFVLPGIGAAIVMGAIWLANRIGPTPGTLYDTLRDLDAFGVRYGAPPGVSAPAAIGLIGLMAVTLVAVTARALFGRRRAAVGASDTDFEAPPVPQRPRKKAAAAREAAETPATDAVFISYARANSSIVTPVVEQLKRLGRNLWFDQQAIGAGDGWAGEIVRAIRTSEGVCVMCSTAAFESDHVKREVYLADRYKKPLLPVFIEDAQPPEDFEYFFASVQQLKLYETPEAERGDALAAALGAA